ncbi:MarR family winged helix-turn-helix transcriptional regulator [Roseomonas populi]|uniref:MarR family winged helix-turn-helix transcriptional regulator n=1 Tax=Roseomonas populi TaxID=3121582 RepID=A0ABT1X4C2_9PROT|nr:MarR family winged helix-turn-helix transcriptional regulator [Roseomonas pecuniae]MCR0981814.1 MarR family winged helix-turn-helix transcriptional regulator [Roseomonas pecuniae]
MAAVPATDFGRQPLARPAPRPLAVPRASRAAAFFTSLVAPGAEQLSIRQAAILCHVVAAPGSLTGRDVGAAVGVGHATVTRAFDQLERMGLAERRPHPKDQRKIVAEPTPTGCAWVAIALAAIGRA